MVVCGGDGFSSWDELGFYILHILYIIHCMVTVNLPL